MASPSVDWQLARAETPALWPASSSSGVEGESSAEALPWWWRGAAAAAAGEERAPAATPPLVHLNNAGCSLPARATLEAQFAYLQLEAAVGGYEVERLRAAALARPYAALASLLHCSPDEIAVVTSATQAWQQVVYGLAWRWRAGDRLLTSLAECEREAFWVAACGQPPPPTHPPTHPLTPIARAFGPPGSPPRRLELLGVPTADQADGGGGAGGPRDPGGYRTLVRLVVLTVGGGRGHAWPRAHEVVVGAGGRHLPRVAGEHAGSGAPPACPHSDNPRAHKLGQGVRCRGRRCAGTQARCPLHVGRMPEREQGWGGGGGGRAGGGRPSVHRSPRPPHARSPPCAHARAGGPNAGGRARNRLRLFVRHGAQVPACASRQWVSVRPQVGLIEDAGRARDTLPHRAFCVCIPKQLSAGQARALRDRRGRRGMGCARRVHAGARRAEI